MAEGRHEDIEETIKNEVRVVGDKIHISNERSCIVLVVEITRISCGPVSYNIIL